MAQQDHIDTGRDEAVKNSRRAQDFFFTLLEGKKDQVMMDDQDLEQFIIDLVEYPLNPVYLRVYQASGFPGSVLDAVHTQHCDLVIFVTWVIFTADKMTESFEWIREPFEDVEYRNVMIAGHDYLGAIKTVQKIDGRFKLCCKRSLREVAAHSNQIRLLFFDVCG
jgi:hypothetical protein